MESRREEAPLMRERAVQFVDTSHFESQQRESMKRKGPTSEKVMRERKLYEASLSGNVDSLNEVMKEDGLILARVCVTCFGETPLHIAAMLGHLEFVIQLVRHMPDMVTQCDSQGFSPLHLASSNGHIEIVKKLLMIDASVCLFCDEDGRTPLYLAVMKGHVQIINELIQARPKAIEYKLNRGETLLHSCVKHNRLEALKLLVELGRVDDLINAKDDDGFTILHLATALKRIETIKYLLNRSGVKVDAVNGNGFTALDMIKHMPRDLKVMEIHESLLNAGDFRAINLPVADGRNSTAVAPPSDVPRKKEITRPPSRGDSSIKWQKESWLEKKRDALMVAATVIAAMAYQAGLNPLGGVWQEDSKDTDKNGMAIYFAGESIMGHRYPEGYTLFWQTNSVSFVASLSIVLLLVSGIPIRRRIFIWILMAAMWVTITSMTFTYLIAMFATSPALNLPKTIVHVIVYSVLVFLGLMVTIFLVHTVRFIIWCIRKVKKLVNKCHSSSATQPQARQCLNAAGASESSYLLLVDGPDNVLISESKLFWLCFSSLEFMYLLSIINAICFFMDPWYGKKSLAY